MSEKSPFIEDFYRCGLCGRKAAYQCANCGSKFCEKCVLKRHGKPENNRYCPKCLCKMHKIPKRWVGSTRPLRKWHSSTKGMKPHFEAPEIYPRSDRKKIMERN